jgi:leader peptidase (prepilin peptidase)/N-methyltransferase
MDVGLAYHSFPVLSDFPPAFLTAVAVCLGLVLGSFANVVIYRLPRGQSLSRPGSTCPSCGAPIRFYDNVPVLSWLVLGGRSRCCKTKINARYPLVELLGGLLAWAIVETQVRMLPPDTPLPKAAALFALLFLTGLGLVAAAFIDLEYMLLPDRLTLGGALLGLASVPLRPEHTLFDAALGAGFGFLLVWLPFDVGYRLLRGLPGMGLGDAKVTLLAGTWFGYPAALFTLMAGAVQGTVFALVLFIVKGRIDEPAAVVAEREEAERALAEATPEQRSALEAQIAEDPVLAAPEPGLGKARLAFGPFLVLGFLEYMLLGPAIIDWLLV